MVGVNKIVMNAQVIIDGIAFEVVNDTGAKRILASDLHNPNYKASFVVRGTIWFCRYHPFASTHGNRLLSKPFVLTIICY